MKATGHACPKSMHTWTGLGWPALHLEYVVVNDPTAPGRLSLEPSQVVELTCNLKLLHVSTREIVYLVSEEENGS